MTQPATEQLLNLANRAERGPLSSDEAQRLRDGINSLHARVQDWRTSTGAGLRVSAELRAERDALAAGVPLVCSDERHKTKVFALEIEIERMKLLVAASSEDGQAIRMAGRFAEKAIENGERAERAEATLNAVRDELAAIDRDRARLDDDCDAFGGGYADAAARIRAVLDQHGQTPA